MRLFFFLELMLSKAEKKYLTSSTSPYSPKVSQLSSLSTFFFLRDNFHHYCKTGRAAILYIASQLRLLIIFSPVVLTMVLLWNTRSVQANKANLMNILQSYNVQVVAIYETWLNPRHHFNISGYSILRCDRLDVYGVQYFQ